MWALQMKYPAHSTQGWYNYYAARFNRYQNPDSAHLAMWYLFIALRDEEAWASQSENNSSSKDSPAHSLNSNPSGNSSANLLNHTENKITNLPHS